MKIEGNDNGMDITIEFSDNGVKKLILQEIVSESIFEQVGDKEEYV